MDGTIELFDALKGPKKLDIGPYRPMQSRPFVVEHDKMFRWYDYWLKAIDNGVLDEERSTEGSPVQPHTRAVPVEPGSIEEYVVHLYPFANSFTPGHRLTVELSCDEPLADEHNALLPPDAFLLPVGRPVTHKIYRDAAHPSRLLLPFATQSEAGRQD